MGDALCDLCDLSGENRKAYLELSDESGFFVI